MVEIASERHSISKSQSDIILSTVLDTVAETVSNDQISLMQGFGTFYSKLSKAKIGHNPATGEQPYIPEKNKPKFRPATAFKNLLLTK